MLNAIDAVRRRQQSTGNFAPMIDVTIDRDQLTFRVDDNGIGMDKNSITRFFATVGASLAEMEQHPQSVGEFGIGVVSYFMAGDSFDLHTWDGVSDPVGLRFQKEMLERGRWGGDRAARRQRVAGYQPRDSHPRCLDT